MTAKEFMLPRFEVVADYPHNPHSVGDVLTCTENTDDATKAYLLAFCEKYPHLFRKMNWWEGRSQEELYSVRYVKRVGGYKHGAVQTIAAPDQNHRIYHVDNEVEFRFIKDSCFIPVSKVDYDAYMAEVKSASK